MTKQELVNLEIERRALLATVNEFNRGDQRMNTELNDMCVKLEKRAEEIQQIINREIQNGN
jgi:hypothetical protein